MTQSKNYHLPLLSGEESLTITVKDWAEQINGDQPDSAVCQIDTVLKDIDDKVEQLQPVAKTGKHSDLSEIGINTHEQIDTALSRLSNTSGTNTGDQTDITGNAATATTLQTARNITLTGDVSGTVPFDGSTDASIEVAYKESGVTPGSYTNVTVDAKGIVIQGSQPTTLAEYGITDAIESAEKGAASGVATLDEAGKVPSAQLPSYVDDVLEFALKSELPEIGEQGKIYVVYGDTKQNSGQYRWTGTTYATISNQIDFATQEEAESGLENTKAMTPLRVFQSIAKWVQTKLSVATTTADGFMSAADKTKLNGIATGATHTVIANNLTTTTAGNALDAMQGKVLNDRLAKQERTLTCTFAASGWSASAPYTQTLNVSGVTANDVSTASVLLSGTVNEKKLQQTAWNMVSEMNSGAGTITAICYNSKPTVNFTLQIKGA